jgi:hypothetical protein
MITAARVSLLDRYSRIVTPRMSLKEQVDDRSFGVSLVRPKITRIIWRRFGWRRDDFFTFEARRHAQADCEQYGGTDWSTIEFHCRSLSFVVKAF